MTSEQIKKLAAAGLTVEQIAVVADMLIEVRNEQKAQGSLGTGFFTHKPTGARCASDPTFLGGVYPCPADRIETKVQHGELTVWPEKPKSDVNDLGFRSESQFER